jgi:hypothetical protein
VSIVSYLLDMEYLAHTQPVENPAPTDSAALGSRIDQRITHILGRTVVPMFNVLIAASGEHRHERDGCVEPLGTTARSPKPQEQVAASGFRPVGGPTSREEISQRSSFGGVRSPSTFSVRTSSPQTTYR